jgi:hypothetical protein
VEGNLQKEVSELQQKEQVLRELQKTFSALQSRPEISKFQNMVPGDQDIPGLLVNLEALSRAKGLVLSAVVLDPKKPESGGLESTTMRLEFTGQIDYPLFKTVLDALEKNLRLFEVVNFSFKPGASSLALEIKTFSLASGAPEAPSASFPTGILQNPKFLELQQFGSYPLKPGVPGNSTPLPLPPAPTQ